MTFSTSRLVSTLLLLSVVAAASLLLSLSLGPSAVGPRDLGALFDGSADSAVRSILIDVRLPRIAMAALVGGALAAAGVVFQGVLRNPLADPFILGVSGGAALGAVVYSALIGTSWGLATGRPLAAFAGSVLTLAILFRFARVRGRTATTTLLLVGVVLNAIDSALILFLVTAGDPARFQGELFFLVGTILPHPWTTVVTVAVFVAAGLLALFALSHRLNLLSLGGDTAAHLGVDFERTLWALVIAASLVTSAAVAFTGLVGFVGLIVPHAVRGVTGPDHRLLIPAATLAGAAFLMIADTIARTLVAPTEIPVGVITTIVGGPVFLVLFLRRLRAARVA